LDLIPSGLPEADRALAALLNDPALLPAIPEPSIAALLDAAARHGVAGLLLHRIAATGREIDARWAGLRDRAVDLSAAAALRDTESMEMLRLAGAEGLSFVVLKGLHLAHTVYPRSWIRERSDTDLLVRAPDLPRFEEFFRSRGYRLLPHVRGELTLPQRHYLRDDSHGFRHAWDLHWRLTSSQALRFALPEDDLWSRAEACVALGGARVPSLPDALMLACIHRLAHHFDDPRLIWLWDIRLLLESASDAELGAFAGQAERTGSAAACAHSLLIARHHAGAVLPDVLQPILGASPHGSVSFLWSGSRRPITYLLGELRAARPADRGRLLRERVLPSLSSMRERYPSVPAVLLPFAYVWRLAVGVPRWLGTK
jgi:hypothetical protein